MADLVSRGIVWFCLAVSLVGFAYWAFRWDFTAVPFAGFAGLCIMGLRLK